VSAGRFVPDRGDVVWIDMPPQAGHEQSGRRPALVLSPASYNERSGLALLCPITNQVKGYPFEVALPPGGGVTGVVLADQVRSLDWRARNADAATRAPAAVVSDVLAKLSVLLGDTGG
jgi:mRNA interferase MazF